MRKGEIACYKQFPFLITFSTDISLSATLCGTGLIRQDNGLTIQPTITLCFLSIVECVQTAAEQ